MTRVQIILRKARGEILAYLRSVASVLLPNLGQIAIALDCALNGVACTLTGSVAYAGETLSAHAWRSRARPFGKFFRPVIDGMFFWQRPDPAVLDVAGRPIEPHCWRAFEKARLRMYLPPEYRT